MNETYKNCNPTICNRSFILSKDGTIMTKEVLKEKCDCVSKPICFELCRLLQDGHRPEAEEMLGQISK